MVFSAVEGSLQLQGTVSGTDATPVRLHADSHAIRIYVENQPITNLFLGDAPPVAIIGVGGVIVTSGTNTVEIDAVPRAITGSDGITITSGTTTVNVAGFRNEFVSTSGYFQTQLNAINVDEIEPAIVGTNGNTVISGASTTTVQGFRPEFISASGYLQGQITSNTNDIANLDSIYATDADLATAVAAFVSASGSLEDLIFATDAELDLAVSGLQMQIAAINVDEVEPAIIGADGITVVSGLHTTTISSFYSEFVAASGTLNSKITIADADVSSLNGLQGAVSITGQNGLQIAVAGSAITLYPAIPPALISGTPDLTIISGTNRIVINDNNRAIVAGSNVTIISGANTITVSSAGGGSTANALIGSDGITIVSGTNTTTIQAFKTEFVAASGHLQSGITNLVNAGIVTNSGLTTFNVPGPLFAAEERQPAGTQGGTFTSGAWRTRTLNNVSTNEIPGASLSANRVTLPPGTYDIVAEAPAYDVDSHAIRLFNVTDNTTIAYSDSALSSPSTEGRAWLMDRVTVSGSSKQFEVQHFCAVTKATIGLGLGGLTLGVPPTIGMGEIYARILVRKIVPTTTTGTFVERALLGDSFVSVVSGTNIIQLYSDAITTGANNLTVSSGTNRVQVDLNTTVTGLISLQSATITGTGGLFAGTVSGQRGVFSTGLTVSGNTVLTSPGMRVRDADGAPNVAGVHTIQVTNGTLSDNGSGIVTINTQGNGGVPVFGDLLATYTASSSPTIDVTGVLSSSYDVYDIVYDVLPANDDVEFWMRTDDAGGASFDSGASDYTYAVHAVIDSVTTAYAGFGAANAAQMSLIGTPASAVGNASNEGISGVISLTRRGSGTLHCQFIWHNVYYNAAGTIRCSIGAGARKLASTVDAIRFLFESGNIASGTVRVYGRHNA